MCLIWPEGTFDLFLFVTFIHRDDQSSVNIAPCCLSRQVVSLTCCPGGCCVPALQPLVRRWPRCCINTNRPETSEPSSRGQELRSAAGVSKAEVS